jgi:NADP-dependent 3-hydroxy acid dehydrogenase YdfG
MVSARGAIAVGFDVDGDAVEATYAELAAAGNRGRGVQLDVRDRVAFGAAVDAVVAEHGKVDVLVNNAGVMPLAFFADHDKAADAWDRCIDINLKGVLHGVCAVYDHMIRQGSGHIVNISSIYGNTGVAGGAVYGAFSKVAVPERAESRRARSCRGAIHG